MGEKKVSNGTIQIIWLVVEVLAIGRSAIATFNVTMNVSNGDTVFSAFTVAVVELSLFAMLLMAGSEAVAPVAAIVLIAFSAVLQFAEIGLLTGTLDPQSKEMIRYAISFAPSVLLLVGLVKRLTSEGSGLDLGGWFNRGRGESRAYGETVEDATKRPFGRGRRGRGSKGAK